MVLFHNEKKVLGIVRKKGVIAINDIVESSELSTATGSRLINHLIEKKFLAEAASENDPESAGKGRPQRYVKWHCPDYYVIGIDVGTTHIKGSLFNLNLDFIKEVDIETTSQKEPGQVFRKINDMIERLYNTHLIEKEKILGIGIAFAGLINKNNKVIKFSPAFNWYDVNINDYLVNKTNLPVFYDNVTRLMALSESYFGYGKEFDNFIFINIGYGIGSNAVIDGNLFTGQSGYAGELGHVIAEPDSSVQCSCGQYGCLTTTSSGEYIAKRFIEQLKNGSDSVLRQKNWEEIDTKMIFEAAAGGDELSISIIDTALSHLAIKIADLKKCFDPAAIIVGGGVSWNRDYFFSVLKEKLEPLNMKYNEDEKRLLCPQSFPGKSATIGAGVMVAQGVLNL
jgi:predicted NBD/HSP70 family sugar kinase